MIPGNPATGARPGRPDIHVWMNLDEAAQSMGLSLADIHEKIDLAELESRINRDGIEEVLVLLPTKGAAASADAEAAIDAEVKETTAQDLLDSLVSESASDPQEEARVARRSARIAWVAAMAMFLAACGASAITAYIWADSQNQLEAMSGKLNAMSQSVGQVSGERDKLAAQITEYRQAAARAQGELAVERKIEDTLFKAALNAKATTPAHPSRTTVADTSN